VLDWLPSMSDSRGRSDKQSSKKEKDSKISGKESKISGTEMLSSVAPLDQDEQNDLMFEKIVKM
jgi:hypothetical protein